MPPCGLSPASGANGALTRAISPEESSPRAEDQSRSWTRAGVAVVGGCRHPPTISLSRDRREARHGRRCGSKTDQPHAPGRRSRLDRLCAWNPPLVSLTHTHTQPPLASRLSFPSAPKLLPPCIHVLGPPPPAPALARTPDPQEARAVPWLRVAPRDRRAHPHHGRLAGAPSPRGGIPLRS